MVGAAGADFVLVGAHDGRGVVGGGGGEGEGVGWGVSAGEEEGGVEGGVGGGDWNGSWRRGGWWGREVVDDVGIGVGRHACMMGGVCQGLVPESLALALIVDGRRWEDGEWCWTWTGARWFRNPFL